MIHVCIERKKKIFVIVNSTECDCAALQLLLLLVLASKKNVFVYFNDLRVYRERKKKSCQILNWLQLCGTAAAVAIVLVGKKKLFVYFNDKK
jgi:hypothetical protein